MDATSNTPAGDQLEGESNADSPGESIHIPADALPPGIKTGDTLKCVAMDENGCTFELTKDADEDDSWEAGVRKEFSPQSQTQEAM